MDANNQLIIKGRFQQKQIENVLRRYIKEYVTCHTCRSPETLLQKDDQTRVVFLQCETCGSRCSVTKVSSGYQAITAKRAAVRAREVWKHGRLFFQSLSCRDSDLFIACLAAMNWKSQKQKSEIECFWSAVFFPARLESFGVCLVNFQHWSRNVVGRIQHLMSTLRTHCCLSSLIYLLVHTLAFGIEKTVLTKSSKVINQSTGTNQAIPVDQSNSRYSSIAPGKIYCSKKK